MVESPSIVKDLQTMLEQVKSNRVGSESLATWAEEQYWSLMEGERKDEDRPEADFLRNILADVMAQWECLLADVYHHQEGNTATAEFPQEWIADWKSQVNCINLPARVENKISDTPCSQRRKSHATSEDCGMNVSNQLTQPKGPMNYPEFEAMLRNHPDKAPGDEEFIDLILMVSKYSQWNPPPNLKEKQKWRRAQNQLILKLQFLENLAHSSHPEFAEAKNYILGVMSTRLRELRLFEGRSIQANLAVFLNHIGQLKYQKIILYKQDAKKPESINNPIFESGQTLEDLETAQPPETWTRPMVPWEILIQQETKTAAQILQQIRHHVEADPGKKLRKCHLQKCPPCNAQVVIIKHKLGKQTLDSLAADFGQPIGTVRAFWTRRVFPMLKEIAAQYYQE